MIYRFEDITLDVKLLKIQRDGQFVVLEPKALRVLLYLVDNRDRVVSKDELISKIWPGTFVTDNALTRVIAQIRKQLGDNARAPRLIETAATTGYRFIAEVTESGGELPFQAPSRKRWLPTAILALVFSTAAMWWTRQPASSGSPLRRIEQITSSAAADLWPSFSPDGSEMAFSSNRSGHFEIYVRSLAAGGAERQITSGNQDNIQPAWSPDGRYLAFVEKVRGGIGLIPASGGSVRYLTESGSDPHWSPDSKTLVYRSTNLNTVREFSSWDSNLLLVDLDGSAPRQLTRRGEPAGGHNYPRFLPDGRHVTFAAHGKRGEQTIWTVDVKTGALDNPFDVGMEFLSYPALNQESPYLYFVGGGVRGPMGLWRARVSRTWGSQPPEPLSPATVAWPRDLTISPNGSQIAFSQEMVQSAIWSVPVDKSGAAAADPKAVTEGHSLRDSSPVFSPDGSKLIYTSSRHGGSSIVYVANADGSSPMPVSRADQDSFEPGWFGPSETLAYQSYAKHVTTYWLSSLQGAPRELKLKLDLSKTARIHVSPDGTKVVGQTGNPDNFQLVVEDLTQGSVHTITPVGKSIGYPVWSPDGKWIAAQERVAGRTNLVLVEPQGGKIVTLVSDPVESWANSWSPDGDRIAFAGLRDGVWNIYWVSRSTLKVHQLTRFTSQSAFVRYPSWSPKDDRVAFEYNELQANIYVADVR